MTLCAETGPICTAYSNDQTIVASVCVSIDRAIGTRSVLAPCGTCQERLALWGPDVDVGVADPADPAAWSSRKLRELIPFYWAAASQVDSAWPAVSDHEW
ncbi:hypothetical protein CLV37_12035 [Kineococcus rhizosphaerae]|uniref:Cytidine deaminase n=2 Tax=Kineococcus rhizosphaerae TaxID=559628 RepID=A0A2T0QWM9_9ACTN|nr:hypothetical protein CLV37_12035 [Kineococcus rhizosphaerae]